MGTHLANIRVHGLVCYGHLLPSLDTEEVENILECISKVSGSSKQNDAGEHAHDV